MAQARQLTICGSSPMTAAGASMSDSWLFCLFLLVIQQNVRLVLAHASSNVHIVYMGERKHVEPQRVHDHHHEILANLFGSKDAAKHSILYNYKHGFSGFAAVLNNSQAKLIADLPGVVCVVPNRVLKLHTTRSWDFLQVKDNVKDGILSESHSGADSIIGIIDTGIWPESGSFKDDGMKAVPSHWQGICQEGEEFSHSNCNKKIIGARWYVKGYEAEIGKLDTSYGAEFLSPRDAVGHGTHTSAIAAGIPVNNASFSGLAKGLARGGAPSAYLAIYKACWLNGDCSSADVLAAFDDAIADGVDVLSISLGSLPPLPDYVDDTIAIGSFHAVAKGITVVSAAGNSGPYPQTVTNTAPWIITVAASTIDRAFPTKITLGNNKTFVGQSLLTGQVFDKFISLVYGGDIAASAGAGNCGSGSLNATLASGKVVLCFESQSQPSVAVAMNAVLQAQGVGLIFAQFPNKEVARTTIFPTVLVDFTIATSILRYLEATRNPVVNFGLTKTVLGQQISPEVAFFSSRGPSSVSPTVLKPDIAAPGVNILAAWSPSAFLASTNPLHIGFQLQSGTSMSCPHVAGVVALMKTVHPTWSPAAIKSALITTASLEDEYGDGIVAEGAPYKQADPFDYGGGHANPNKAIDPGLVYDVKNSDYIQFLCAMGYNNTAISSMTGAHMQCKTSLDFLKNLNLPSISIPELKKGLTVWREVTNVGTVNSIYKARIQAPPGIEVRVEPSILVFTPTVKKQKFKVTFRPRRRVQGRYGFGYLYWEDGSHVVRMPLVVRSIIEESYAET